VYNSISLKYAINVKCCQSMLFSGISRAENEKARMSTFYKHRFFAYIYLIFNRAYFDSKTMFLLTILSEIQKMKRFYVMKNYRIIIVVVAVR